MARAFLGLGSSVAPKENLHRALSLIVQHSSLTLTAISTFYRTPPLPAPGSPPSSVEGDPWFLNGVVAVETHLGATELTEVLASFEASAGRIRGPNKYAPRRLDLDLLLFHSEEPSHPILHEHPDIRTRPWVAYPLLELAPDLHLSDGTHITQVTAAFPGPGGEKDGPFTESLRRAFPS
jgi:2-amino-4-hydroxy-6-hydroxymethyldihydropteridine diphosphokinase